jgi:diguanylate cyclase (GGDEF)-like protein
MISNNTVIIIVDKDLNLVEVDEAYSKFVGKGQENSLLSNVHPFDQHLLYEMVEEVEKNDKSTACFRLLGNSDEYRWIFASCIRQKDSEEFSLKLILHDISELGKEKDEDDDVDFGTGLLNKKAITDYARQKCSNINNRINLCILDIDNFKQINDTRGHLYGDKVLKDVSSLIISALGDGGKAGRIGGDELMLVIEKAEDKPALRNYLRGIREEVEKRYLDANGFPMITVSIGAATFPDFADNYETLFNLADRMLYRAKSRGKNRYVIYTPEIHGTVVDGVLREGEKITWNAHPQDKTKLVLETIDGFFGHMNEAVPSEVSKILATYNLDEAYVFYKDLNRAFCGNKKLEDNSLPGGETVRRIVDSQSDIQYIEESGFDEKFSSDGVLVIDRPQQQLSDTPGALDFYNEHGIKHAFIFKMDLKDFPGYVAFYNTNELSRKFPQADVADFTYLSKMIEIALKSR